VLEVHAYNPSYSGGWDQEDHSSRPAQIVHETLPQKKNHKKRAGGMAPGKGPEFKPQYHKTNKQTKKHETVGFGQVLNKCGWVKMPQVKKSTRLHWERGRGNKSPRPFTNWGPSSNSKSHRLEHCAHGAQLGGSLRVISQRPLRTSHPSLYMSVSLHIILLRTVTMAKSFLGG
jgi:hypothetical protein